MPLDYKKEGKIATFTFNRPDVMNAIDPETRTQLKEALEDFRDDPDLWVGILTGAGDKAFSAGADLKSRGTPTVLDNYFGNSDRDLITLGLNLWKPLIAAINGYCLGFGLEISLLCDIRIAAEHAKLGLPEVARGIFADNGGTQRLTRMLARCHAAEIILTGKQISAQDAFRMGLVNQVVPLDQLMPAAMEMAEHFCTLAPLSVRASKEAMIKGADMTLRESLVLERNMANSTRNSEDSEEGKKAFIEKRRPVYKGR